MGLNINLFVHGVPMGQKIWGPEGEDSRYISSFYGPNWDAPEVMKTDVMTFGGITYCYYSFVKGQNVFDSQSRAGSYFALTLRVNAFYCDVQNIYNILKATYDKMCVGLCVQENENSVKYLLSDFQNIDSNLRNIESHILDYISKFSINNDLVSLSGFSVNTQSAIQKINLHECTKTVALDIAKKTGKLMLSPWYLSSNATNTIAKYKSEVQATEQRAQQKIDIITQQSNEKIKQIEENSHQKISRLKEEKDREMAELKQSYSNVNSEIERLRKKTKESENEITHWKKQCFKFEEELETLRQKGNKSPEKIRNNSHSKVTELWKFIIANKMLVIAVVILFLLLGLYKCINNSKKDKKIDNQEIQFSKTPTKFYSNINDWQKNMGSNKALNNFDTIKNDTAKTDTSNLPQ